MVEIPVHLSIPRDASLDGHLVDGAFRYLAVATGICFGIMLVVLIGALLFHRARGGRRVAFYTHGDQLGHYLITCLVGLAMFLAIDAVLAARASNELRDRFWRYPVGDPNAVRVEVTARQWAWTFRLPGPDGRFGTPDDVVTLGELHVPVGRPIYFKLRAKDVIHSFYVPSMRTKVDVIPGSTTRLWFQAETTGRYEIGCAQHCGVGHYKMRAELIVAPAGEHERWLRRAEVDARLRYDPADAEAHDGWDWESGT
jgi:cytochrome c oxidase subunit 2